MYFKMPILLACLFLCTSAIARDFYVSPTGSDKLDGSSPNANFFSKTGPFKTLHRAQRAVRDLAAKGPASEQITIHMGKGTYQLPAPLIMNANDSGQLGKDIIWEGDPDGSILSGGIELNSCEPISQGVINCPVNAAVIENISGISADRLRGKAPKFELFINDKKMHLSRWPDNGWARIKTPIKTDTERNFEFQVFEAIPKFQSDSSEAQVHIFPGNDFFDEYIGISDIDYTNNEIRLAKSTTYELAAGRRFYIENLKSALNFPEEWYYDRENSRIQFIPPRGVSIKKIVISAIPNIVKLESSSNIKFTNLKLQNSTDSAVTLAQSKNITFNAIEINNTNGKAIDGSDSVNVTVSNSFIHETGTGGISLYGGDRPSLQPSGNYIHNNTFTNYDTLLFTNSPAIDVGGVATTVSNNLILKGNGEGIRITGNDQLIEKNEITSICQQSGDCGGIYSGRDWTFRGNTIRFNSLHNYTGYRLNENTLDIPNKVIQYENHGARGIYLDDAASGFTVYGNILNNTGAIGIQVGGGRDNLIENNIIITNKYAILVDYRGGYFDWNIPINSLSTMPIQDPLWTQKYPDLAAPMNKPTWPEGNKFHRNIIISTKIGGRSLQYWMPKQRNTVSENIVWNPNEEFKVDYILLDVPLTKFGASWQDWIKRGPEKNSVNADPCLEIIGNVVEISCDDSPAYQIGFELPPSDIGLIN